MANTNPKLNQLKQDGASTDHYIRWDGAQWSASALDADLVALAALSSTGYVTRTGTTTYANRTITGSDDAASFNTVTVVNGNGVSGNTVISVASPYSTVKLSVEAATTANITLSGSQTIDGVSIVTNNRVLVKNQTTASENGIYVAAAGAWARATDFGSSLVAEHGLLVYVQSGTVNGGKYYKVNQTLPTIGTTSLSFSEFGGGSGPAGANYQVQYYDSGIFGADANFNFDPSNDRLVVGTTTATATLHGRAPNDTGATVLRLENVSGNDIVKIVSSGYIQLGDNETYPNFYQSATTGGAVSYTANGITFQGSYTTTGTNDILGLTFPTQAATSGAKRAFHIAGSFTPGASSSAEFDALRISTTIDQTSVTSGTTRGVYITPSVTNLQDFRGVEINVNSANAFGIKQNGSSTKNAFEGAVYIGANTANASAILEADSTTKGLLIPRMTTTERNAISSPANGLIIYNTTTNKFTVRENSAWSEMGSSSVTAHSALTGLTSGDDHTQYAFLAGRSGGQIYTGGTASGDDLTLRSTTNATKGSVILNDQGGDVLIGGASTVASTSLVVQGSARAIGTLVSSGTGTITSSLSSASIRFINTTGGTGDTHYIGGTNTGTLTISSGNASTMATFETTGALTLAYGLTIGSVSGTATSVIGRSSTGVVSGVTIGTGLALSSGTLSANQQLSVNTQTGTTYTLALTDAGKLVTLSNASAIALTIPTNASVAFPTGTVINISQLGAGQVTVGGSGVTINSADGDKKLRVQYSSASLTKIGTDTWLLVGDITA